VEVYPPFESEYSEDYDVWNVLEAYKDNRPLHGKWTRDEGWLST
jgi:hypothetical protein